MEIIDCTDELLVSPHYDWDRAGYSIIMRCLIRNKYHVRALSQRLMESELVITSILFYMHWEKCYFRKKLAHV